MDSEEEEIATRFEASKMQWKFILSDTRVRETSYLFPLNPI